MKLAAMVVVVNCGKMSYGSTTNGVLRLFFILLCICIFVMHIRQAVVHTAGMNRFIFLTGRIPELRVKQD